MYPRSYRKTAAIATIIMTILYGASVGTAAQMSRTTAFDRDWQFHLGDDVKGAEAATFDASSWRKLDVPHDWMIEGPAGRDPAKMEGPFDPNSPTGFGGAYLNGGIGWYRKSFTLPEATKGCRVFVRFDGVYMDSDVWINGHHLGNHPYGYTGFQYDLTPHLNFGKTENVLAVRANVTQPCSRWYSGAGIYRHVWLAVCNPLHIAQHGTYVTTPEVGDSQATVRVRTRVCNESTADTKAALTTILFDATGKKIAAESADHEIAAGGEYEFDQSITVSDVRRWSLEVPSLYRAECEVRMGKEMTDRCSTPFGIRTLRFTVEEGFFLNDKQVPIRGVCDHHDLGCLGAAVNRRAIQRQLEILRSFGCNAIRTSHNPPAPELLELCDQMGFLVMDEAFDEWKEAKTEHGYGRFFDKWSEPDLVSMIHRDRNHPCIVLWSIGNEIPEQKSADGWKIAKRLQDICHREDPSRPVTSGLNLLEFSGKNQFADTLDVIGINYHIPEYTQYRGKVLVAAETASALSTRGEYNLVLDASGNPKIRTELNHQCTSYDLLGPKWGNTAEDSLLGVKNAPWVAGEFVWTGFDYLGEPTPFTWPSRSSYFGIVDLCGFPKDRYYLYQSQWTDKPVVHLLPHWNWQGWEGKRIPVWCFTNAESVELFLNGKSLGEKSGKDITRLHYEWSVPYAPGELKAVGKRGGKTIAVDTVHTTGEPARLLLMPDRRQIRADGRDLSFAEVRIVDSEGYICPERREPSEVHYYRSRADRRGG